MTYDVNQTFLAIILFFSIITIIAFGVAFLQYKSGQRKEAKNSLSVKAISALTKTENSSNMVETLSIPLIGKIIGTKRNTITKLILSGEYSIELLDDLQKNPDLIVELYSEKIIHPELSQEALDKLSNYNCRVYLISKKGSPNDVIVLYYGVNSVKGNMYFEDSEEEMLVMNYVYLYNSKFTKFKLAILYDLFKKYRLERLPKKQSPKTALNYFMYQIIKLGNHFSTKQVQTTSIIKDENELATHYEKIELEFDGKRYEASLKDLVPIIMHFLSRKANVFIMGAMGTGKTIFADYICYRLNHETDNKIFYINSGSIKDILSPEFDSFSSQIFNINNSEVPAEDLLSETINTKTVKKKTDPVNIMYIDEAQKALEQNAESSDVLLSLLDGTHKRMYNTAYLLMFNEFSRKIDPATFRPGRTGLVIHLTPLKAETAKKTVASIKAKLTPDEVFDDTKFNNTLNNVNLLQNTDVPYAGANEITLADVYGCVTVTELSNLLQKSLETAAKPIAKIERNHKKLR